MFYKVVRKDSCKGLLSSMSFHLDVDVTYIPNEWVYPKIGMLFIFTNLDYAINYADIQLNRLVWECEIMGVNPLPNRAKYFLDVHNFWKTPLSDRALLPSPKGTAGTYGVKLIKEVYSSSSK